jgi:probable HAF family extracellular repeat protein
MNSKTWSRVMVLTLFAALAVPVPIGAQGKQNHHSMHHHYQFVDIGTFGGPDSSNAWAGIGNGTMNSKGTIVGEAATSVSDPYCLFFPFQCFVADAFQWQNGVITDLQGLPGNANGTYADSINSRGRVSGISGNGAIDPLTGFPEMDAVFWKHGKIADLGTLGGNASAAYGINDRDQVVGAALNTVLDPFSSGFPTTCCIAETYTALFFPSATQMHAVLWHDGVIKDLGTLGGPDSVAWQINERGQIAGQSYVNSIPNETTGVPTIDPFFIGEDGNMVDLGSLGGTDSWTTGLNNRGQVIGAMTLAGDGGWHPFLWSHGVLTDLGTLGVDCGNATALNDAGEVVGVACSPTAFFATLWRNGALTNLGTIAGDTCSESDDINSQGQIVGESSDCGGPNLGHAWLWEKGGPMVDLNTLIPPGSGIQLTHGVSINDRGEISGDGVLPSGDGRAFVLIPCDENHPGVEGCDYSLVDAAPAAKTESPRAAQHSSARTGNGRMPVGLRGRMRARMFGRQNRFATSPLE